MISLIRSHHELRPILSMLENSTRAVEFSQEARASARPLICKMLTQTAEDRLPATFIAVARCQSETVDFSRTR